MQINKLISKYNFNPGSVSRIKYIVIHYCGAVGTAKNNADYFAGGDRGASAHYFVGYEGEVWQSVEDANVAWHCGAKKYQHPECRNANSIGIELCTKTTGSTKKADENWYFEDATVSSAIELTKELMKKYNVPADHVIRHYDVTGKVCPAPYVFNTGKHTWDQFKAAISQTATTVTASSSKDPDADDSKVIWDYLTGTCGLNAFAAAGVIGNLYAESGLRANNLQNSYEKKLGLDDATYTAAVDSGAYSKDTFVKDKAGYGLAQWTYWSRKQALYEFVKAAGKSIGDLQTQLAFFWKEVSANKALLNKLQNAGSILEASNAILHDYERPADQSATVEQKRASYGETFYKLYSGKTTQKPAQQTSNSAEFKVKVSIPYLNIRKGPGTNYAKTGKYTGVGVFTVVETQNGWGRLKSGAGWISLDYAKRV